MLPVKSSLPKVSNFLFKLYSSGAKGPKNCSTAAAGKGCKKVKASNSKKGKSCSKSESPSENAPPGGKSIIDQCDMFDNHRPNLKKWKLRSYCLVTFAVGLCTVVLATAGHSEPEYIPYEHLYIRSKRFAWRDGRTSLFHGPNNFIPDVEEKRIDSEQEEAPADGPRYKKRVNEHEEKLKKLEQHAEEELERRKRRHQKEAQEQKP